MPAPKPKITRIRLLVSITGAVMVAVIVGLLVVTSLSDRAVNRATGDWQAYMDEVEAKAVLLTRLRGSDGFGGLADGLGLLLRGGEATLAASLQARVNAVDDMVARYGTLPLTDSERFGLRALRASLAEFRDKLGVATHMSARGVPPAQIAEIVPRDDGNAVMALDLLREAWTQAAAAQRTSLSNSLRRVRWLTGSTLFVVPVLLMAALLVGWLGWRMTHLSDEAARQRAGARQKDALYRDLVTGSLQGLVIHEDFTPLFVNPAFLRMFGLRDPDEGAPLPNLLDLVDEQYRDDVRTVHSSIKSGDLDSWSGRIRCVDLEGNVVWVEDLVRPIQWHGRAAVQVTVLNITDQVRHEEDIEMERGVTERQAREVVALAEELDAALQLAEEQKAQLHRLSIGDPLTGAFNRRHFLNCAHEELARLARQPGRSMCVMAMDIDHFKHINDHYGHAAGDEALRVFTNTCHRLLRETDVFGRMGGEEFAALLPGTDLAQARVVGDRILRAVRDLRIEPGDTGTWPAFGMTVCLGLALVEDPADPIEVTLHRADEALYGSKRAGRDRLTIAEATTTGDAETAPS